MLYDDCWSIVLQYTSSLDIFNLIHSSKLFAKFDCETLWHEFLQRDFKGLKQVEQSYKEQFRYYHLFKHFVTYEYSDLPSVPLDQMYCFVKHVMCSSAHIKLASMPFIVLLLNVCNAETSMYDKLNTSQFSSIGTERTVTELKHHADPFISNEISIIDELHTQKLEHLRDLLETKPEEIYSQVKQNCIYLTCVGNKLHFIMMPFNFNLVDDLCELSIVSDNDDAETAAIIQLQHNQVREFMLKQLEQVKF